MELIDAINAIGGLDTVDIENVIFSSSGKCAIILAKFTPTYPLRIPYTVEMYPYSGTIITPGIVVVDVRKDFYELEKFVGTLDVAVHWIEKPIRVERIWTSRNLLPIVENKGKFVLKLCKHFENES